MPETFHWKDCAATLQRLAADADLVLEPKRRFFESERLRVRTPLVFPIPEGCASVNDYVDSLPEEPGRHSVILMQAGAVSLGRFEGARPLIQKSLRKYVVRGRGRAQPLHLKTKGKSRYGSRLRLQNATPPARGDEREAARVGGGARAARPHLLQLSRYGSGPASSRPRRRPPSRRRAR